NTLKHEYPEFGFKWEVVHHTELLDQLLKSGKIKLKGGNGHTAVLHDSCFLARYNEIIDEPRNVLKAAGYKMVEVPRSGDLTFCCGGGGGRAWLEEHYDPEKGINRINFNRTDELMNAGADTIIAACPLCMMMFDEATKRTECEDKMSCIRLLDIAEAVAEKLDVPTDNQGSDGQA
ncbi:MAG TPA: (Fe-S)-binding protein, partial [bacterium]|nr:(Fe-S)-binding protein [bacterium]